jgi:DNA-binding NtrC family response regulator
MHEQCLAEDVIKRLESLAWLGNVRQLENEVHREFLMSENKCDFDSGRSTSKEFNSISPQRFDEEIYQMPLGEAKKKVIEEFEREYLIRVIAETNGNVTQASIRAGKERRALGKMLKKYHIYRHG